MAEASVLWAQDQLVCPVCLDLLKEPVTLPCGHNYCMTCITDYWRHQDQWKVYICPQCRQNFTVRPALNKNTMLDGVVEQLKKTKLQTEAPGDVKCDVCTGRKHKAVKSCLMCLKSYCQNHLEHHETFFQGTGHYLMDANGQLQEMICSRHGRLLEVFCRTDQQCICTMCLMENHKNHDTVSTAVERSEKERNLKKKLIQYQQKIQEREKDIHELRAGVEYYKRSAQAAVMDSEKIFNELIRAIKTSRSEVTRLIRDQEKAAVSRAEELVRQLDQEVNDLRKRRAEVEHLSHTDDHIHFLQGFLCLSSPLEHTERITVTSPLYSNDITQAIYKMRDKIENFCKEEIKRISVKPSNIVLRPRNDFLQNYLQFTLDPNTVNKHICLSKRNRVAAYTDTIQHYSDHPDRFDVYYQVMCGQSVCGRCYWEVEWYGEVGISVSYKQIKRKGTNTKCLFGHNDQSWSLFCSASRSSFRHNEMETDLAAAVSSRIGVYVDHSAGTLSFYSVSHTMSLIYRVHTTFTQPLYPGFRLSGGSVVNFCDPAV